MLQDSQCWVIHVLLFGGALCVRHVTTSHGYRSIPFSLRMQCSIIAYHMWLTCHRYRDHCLSVGVSSSLLQTTRHVAAFALSIHLRSAQCFIDSAWLSFDPLGKSLSESNWLPRIIRPWSPPHQTIIHKHITDSIQPRCI